MKTNNSREIINILYLYPIAKAHLAEIHESINYSDINEVVMSKYKEKKEFYQYIEKSVNLWVNCLFDDEKEVLDLHYFKNYNIEKSAYILNYSGHSSVSKKLNQIIKKIEKVFF